MRAPKISVIVPVFNSEDFLSRCIGSILNQNFDNFELLLINDGSLDKSGEICENYAKLDSRVIVLHKPNGGVSSARNLGLDNAKGEYVCFIDSDDFVSKNYLGDLLDDSPSGQSGIVIQGYNRYNLEGRLIRIHKYPNSLLSPKDFRLAFSEFQLFFSGGPVSKLFNTKILNERRIRFDTRISLGEDLIFLLEYLRFTNFIKFSDAVNYHYPLNSYTTLSQSPKSFDSDFLFFKRYLQCLKDCEATFSIEKEFLTKAYEYGYRILIRAIAFMYRPLHKDMTKGERIHNLRLHVFGESEMIKRYFQPNSIFDKLNKYLLVNRQFKFFDFLNNLLFGLRYSLGKYWILFASKNY